MNKKLTAAFIISILAAFFVPITAYAEFDQFIRVGLVQNFTNQNSIRVNNTSIFAGMSVDEGFMPLDELHSPGGFTVRASGGGVEILSGNIVMYTFSGQTAAQIMASDGGDGAGSIDLGTHRYRGVMEFVPSGGRISAVNILSIEEYLFGVLPAEMSPSFQPEALKAQAVASRSFSFHQVVQSKHPNQPFDICDTTCCQVYRGAGSEDARTNEAVLATYGLMLFFNGNVISAHYFSSSGGATENSEDIWWEARAYLRSVNEITEHNPMIWERTYTWAQLTNAAAHHGARIGTVEGVSISRLSPGGRAHELTFHGTAGTWSTPRSVGVTGFFRPIGGTLPSRNFQMVGGGHTTPTVYVTDGFQTVSAPLNSFYATCLNGAIARVHHAYIYDGETTRRINSSPTIVRGGAGITLHGRGWGHGVGMSQLGAEGMARLGHTFEEILHHYYQDIEIRRNH
ncbi:MAG: SpoIID/LytB domain-containing protein [Defluviitaleaceae bacterium]|nr:SpoIID/LytB domain-containing protein [Defluviitaleaceae bacterium]